MAHFVYVGESEGWKGFQGCMEYSNGAGEIEKMYVRENTKILEI